MLTKVLVVDDSAFMRKVITDILQMDNTIKVIGTAKNGKEALDKINEHLPDVVTLDVEMPIMGGLDCLKQIMKTVPVPVIMLSSLTEKGADLTIKALELGAVDFITKPTKIFDIYSQNNKQEIIDKIKVAKNVVIKPNQFGIKFSKSSTKVLNNKLKKIVGIGTSTGGPRALQQVIPYIPGDVPAAFAIVQHMPKGFTKSLAMRLNSMSELTVKEAEDGDILKAGYAYIAPGDYHMVIKNVDLSGEYVIKLNKNEPVGGHRPSVDVMFNSLADTGNKNIIGVIMTGMGCDGCEGLKNMKKSINAPVIAQDKNSCVIYGMPRCAVEAEVVDVISPLKQITKEIIKLVGV